ncbi:protein kinase [Pseudonocardia petroleophila]|uniref:non-specific serine/threonine protein kinase n=1 Tax=Pseudonocardia petroleophila TaxID=37331 RepID=A0A7G7MBJ8_9PSEU|nr:serine/threonine-protein kinase [Pseudonocardia petroleophila]QNG50159.1 protein kinase [Pseudonocardia petroleophila]
MLPSRPARRRPNADRDGPNRCILRNGNHVGHRERWRDDSRCAVAPASGRCGRHRAGISGVMTVQTGNAVWVTTTRSPGADGLLGGRYALGEVLGIGSSAVVRRAEDVRTGRFVAVKLFSAGGSLVEHRRRRREVEALTRLRHPGLVRLLDGDPTGACPFVVTELVEGPTLAQALVEGAWGAERVRRVGAVVAAALAVVHVGGFVHRDVKPANILLDGGGRPRLADFGVAWAVDGATATTAGAVVGTAAYMSPEQVAGLEVGPATDVYALGLVLIEALTGRREYPGSAVESAVARLSRSPRVPGGLPVVLASAIGAMTRTDPAQRPGAAEVATLLSDTAASTGGPGASAPRSRSRRGLLAATACVLALGVAGADGTSAPSPPVAEGSAPTEAAIPPVTSMAPTGPATGRQDEAAPVARSVPEGTGPTEATVVPAVGGAERSPDQVPTDDPTARPVEDADDGSAGADAPSEEEAGRPGNGGGPGGNGRGRDHVAGPPGRADD